MATIDSLTAIEATSTDTNDVFILTVDNMLKTISVAELRKALAQIDEVAVSADTYTLLSSDQNKIVRATSANAKTFTVPATSGFTIGLPIIVKNTAATDITLVADTGVTLHYFSLTIEQYQSFALIPRATDDWDVYAPADATASLIQLSTPVLTISNATSSTLDFDWTNVANESSYYVQIAEDAGFTVNVQTATPAADDTNHQFTGLNASTTYYGRVKAVGDGVTYSDSAYGTDNEATTAGGYDADAQAYITAEETAGSIDIDVTNETAISNLIAGFKTDSVWAKIKGLYLGYGTGLINAKSPGTFNATAPNGVTINASGYTFNGTNQYLDTGIVEDTDLGVSNESYAFYIKTISASTNLCGCTDGSGTSYFFPLSGGSVAFRIQDASDRSSSANASAAGTYVATRRDETTNDRIRLTKDGVEIYNNVTTAASGQTTATYSFYIGARNGSGVANLFSDATIGLALIGTALTDTDMTNINSRISTFITATSRT